MELSRITTTGLPEGKSEYKSGHTATLCGHFVFALGGYFYKDGTARKGVDAVLNTRTLTWHPIPLHSERWFHRTVLVDDRLITIGGEREEHNLEVLRKTDVTVYDIVLEAAVPAETYSLNGRAFPMNIRKHIAEYFESKREIVVHGGRPAENETRYTDQLYALSVDDFVWRKLRFHGQIPLDQASHMSSLDAANDRMFVWGTLPYDRKLGKLHEFDYSGRVPCWTEIQTQGSIPHGLYGGVMDLVNGDTLVLFGGLFSGNYKGLLFKYDMHSSEWTSYQPRIVDDDQSEETQDIARARHCSIVYGDKIHYYGGQPNPRVRLDTILQLDY